MRQGEELILRLRKMAEKGVAIRGKGRETGKSGWRSEAKIRSTPETPLVVWGSGKRPLRFEITDLCCVAAVWAITSSPHTKCFVKSTKCSEFLNE